jgi:hypothetical protein
VLCEVELERALSAFSFCPICVDFDAVFELIRCRVGTLRISVLVIYSFWNNIFEKN